MERIDGIKSFCSYPTWTYWSKDLHDEHWHFPPISCHPAQWKFYRVFGPFRDTTPVTQIILKSTVMHVSGGWPASARSNWRQTSALCVIAMSKYGGKIFIQRKNAFWRKDHIHSLRYKKGDRGLEKESLTDLSLHLLLDIFESSNHVVSQILSRWMLCASSCQGCA